VKKAKGVGPAAKGFVLVIPWGFILVTFCFAKGSAVFLWLSALALHSNQHLAVWLWLHHLFANAPCCHYMSV
jgi:hypothetical protein